MKDYNQLLDGLITQLDSLISFMGVSHKEVFELLHQERAPWFGDSADKLPELYATYRMQVIHSAFLLGYSYFESFLTDMLKVILRSRPTMLPKDRKLSYRDIIEADSKDEIMDHMINREIFDLLYKNMTVIVSELRKRYNFTVTSEQETELCKISLIRNCIMHNSSCADTRLAEYDGYQKDTKFELSSEQVHSFGIMLRSLVRSMVTEANINHNIEVEQNDSADA